MACLSPGKGSTALLHVYPKDAVRKVVFRLDHSDKRSLKSVRYEDLQLSSTQVAGMYCIGLLTVPAAYAALFCIAQTTAGLGLQLPYAASPAMYAVAALTALVSPLFIPMLFLLVPVRSFSTATTSTCCKFPSKGLQCSLGCLTDTPLPNVGLPSTLCRPHFGRIFICRHRRTRSGRCFTQAPHWCLFRSYRQHM